MSNFRIVILVLLVVALAVLGLIYVNLSGRMDVLQQQQQLAVSSSAPAANASSPYLPMPTQAAPASKGTSPAQGAATAQGGTGKQQTAPQGAPTAKDTHNAQAAPVVVKGSPAPKGAPAAQSVPPPADALAKAPAAGQSSPATSPTLQPPSAPLDGSMPEQRDSIVGSYGGSGSLVEVKASGKGYYVAVSTASPDARWICEMEGLGVLEGDVLHVTSVSSGQSVVVPIQFKGDALIIPATQAATCGFGGSIEGVYKKK